MKRTRLSQRQHEILIFLREYIAEHGRAPLLREIAASIGRTVQTADEHLRALLAKGFVRRDAAGLRLVSGDPRGEA